MIAGATLMMARIRPRQQQHPVSFAPEGVLGNPRLGASYRPLATGPVRTPGTGLANWVVDAFFVWTAENAWADDDSADVIALQKGEHLTTDIFILPHVRDGGQPLLHRERFGAFLVHNAYGDFRRTYIVRAVEGYRSERIPLKASFGLTEEAISRRPISHRT